MSVFKIHPTMQQYDWGKSGFTSVVAQLAAASGVPSLKDIDERKPYAELWMGTHPTSPSLVLSTHETLSSHLAAHPELMGQKVIRRFESQGAERGNLPFLFKILSIGKALSIQAHPDKQTAEEFHKRLPGIYKDDNHKPEMALAITPFRALCGFRPLHEIAAYLRSTPELAALIPHDVLTAFLDISSSPSSNTPKEKSALKALFGALMTTPEEKVKSQLDILVSRYHSTLPPPNDKEIVDLVLLLSSQYPNDIGIFCAFLLNHIHLSPGNAIFLGAGEPHAYLSGDCIECMANSDNVIRAGLTPKLRDVERLVGCLTYEAGEGGRHAVTPSFVVWSSACNTAVLLFSTTTTS